MQPSKQHLNRKLKLYYLSTEGVKQAEHLFYHPNVNPLPLPQTADDKKVAELRELRIRSNG